MIMNGHNNNLNNNVFENNIRGLDLFSSSENEVYENIFEENSYVGIEMSGYQTCGRNNIHDNTIKTNGMGIYVQGGTAKNRIESNYIYDNSYDGIDILGSKSNIIINNNIYSNGYIYGGTHDGINCTGGWNVISNNQIYKNASTGIELQYDGSNKVSGNTIYSNEAGIRLINCDQNLIDDNDIYNNGDRNGIVITCSDYNHITNNRLKENWSAGIAVYNGMENVIRNNDIDKTGRSATKYTPGHLGGAILLSGGGEI